MIIRKTFDIEIPKHLEDVFCNQEFINYMNGQNIYNIISELFYDLITSEDIKIIEKE